MRISENSPQVDGFMYGVPYPFGGECIFWTHYIITINSHEINGTYLADCKAPTEKCWVHTIPLRGLTLTEPNFKPVYDIQLFVTPCDCSKLPLQLSYRRSDGEPLLS